MKAVLISIHPKWCKMIASGVKTVEVRKTKPKIETPFKCYIYCTKQKTIGEILLTCDKKVVGRNRGFRDNGDIPLSGKVIGEFVCDYIEDFKEFEYGLDALHRHIKLNACLGYDEIYKYLGFEKRGYGWHISDLKIYDKPKELSEFSKKCEKFACEGCEHLKYQRVNADEYDYECEYFNYNIPITRPPQSWCYVEGKEDEGNEKR